MPSAWFPQQLTRQQLEERRLEAAKLIGQGDHTRSALAKHFSVSMTTIDTWIKRYRAEGEAALKATLATGRPAALTAEQKSQLVERLRQGPKAHGQQQDLWTTKRIADLIGVAFGVWYHHDHVRKLLHQLGWTYQKPEKRAVERDEQAIAHWVEVTYPELVKKVEQGASIVFADESGSSLKTTVVKTWAPCGQTPTVETKLNWKSLSIIAGLTNTGKVYQHTYEHSVKAMQVQEFLQHLLDHIPGNVIVFFDRPAIHRAKSVQAFVEAEPRLTVEYLPAYAPECNPIEWLWAYIKRNVLGNACIRTLGELKQRWRVGFGRIRRKNLVPPFYAASALPEW
nr:IS630 family transposase [Deinococcus peraridilitoris]